MSKEKQNITGHLREYRDDIKQAIDVMNKRWYHTLPHRHNMGHRL